MSMIVKAITKVYRISGVAERGGRETCEQTTESVNYLLEAKLELPPLNIERAHRMGQSQAWGQTGGDRGAAFRPAVAVTDPEVATWRGGVLEVLLCSNTANPVSRGDGPSSYATVPGGLPW
ncbi:hypothetical protein Pcinc_002828 [Petrolisthes cinctipes]|uniref:Uncharacterized protein n=1 Tax=Petrolisthes cinctipes TaxID=88211 RepID=A0AAE1GK96_PETCI|nr:hypothetical protein Pcinc_002828 [Petrolisthes cinctipes]